MKLKLRKFQDHVNVTLVLQTSEEDLGFHNHNELLLLQQDIQEMLDEIIWAVNATAPLSND